MARQLVANLDLQNTNYEHGAGTVRFDPPCVSRTDCSGFADALLRQCYGVTPDQFRQWLGSGRPTARRYHDAIVEQRGFKRIEHVQDVRPGDLLAVKYLKRTDNTGHVMLAAGRPAKMPATAPIVAGTTQWSVAVIDSSKSGHGPSDTRHKRGTNGKDHDGLGAGVFRIYTDNHGAVTGFAWSTVKSSKFTAPQDEDLVIGRLDTSEGK